MIFSNPAYNVDHNVGMPPVGSQYESVRKVWELIGRYHQNPVQEVLFAPIGKRLLATVGHIPSVGMQIDIQGRTVTVTSLHESTYRITGTPGNGQPGGVYSIDMVYVEVDQDIPEWFPRVQNEHVRSIDTDSVLLHIGGGAGGKVVSDGDGCLTCVVDPDYAKANRVRWSMQRVDYYGPYNPYPPNPVQPDSPKYLSIAGLFKAHDAPDGHPETGSPRDGDSGSPCFVDCGPPDNPWVFVGCVSGPGSGAVSPCRGDVQTGTGCSLVLLDDAQIRELNGEPPAPPLAPVLITYHPTSVVGGESSIGHIGISGPAPPGGQVVELTSLDPDIVTVPGSVTVNQGLTEATFPITTHQVGELKKVEIFAEIESGGISTGIGVEIEIRPVPALPTVDPDMWTDYGYETLIQSEPSLYAQDNEKTVRQLALDYAQVEDNPPLLCHSQIGVGGFPVCSDWWNSEPWEVACNLFPEAVQKASRDAGVPQTMVRDAGPMAWPYHVTGRYVSWRIYLSNNPDEDEILSFEPKGGNIDFNRVALTMSLKDSCL